MKTKIIPNEELDIFTPVAIQITIESEEELRNLYSRLDAPSCKIDYHVDNINDTSKELSIVFGDILRDGIERGIFNTRYRMEVISSQYALSARLAQ